MTVTIDRPKPFRAGATGEATAKAAMPAFTGTYVLLADLSEFQANVADAAYLAWSKAIIIRACYGDAHDDEAWYGGQRRALLHSGGARFLGIYAYLVGSQSGAAQAQAFHHLVGQIRPGEVFIADFEEGSKSVLTAWYDEMLSLYGAGIAPYLWTYSGLSFGTSAGVMPVDWIAAYQASEPSPRHKLWQFTDAYQVPGVGKCDASVWHGSIDQLAALAYQGSSPAPSVKPGIPTNGTTASITPTSAVLHYTGVPGGVKYDVQVTQGGTATGKQVFRKAVGGESGKNGVPVASLTPGTRYGWRIAAYNAAGVAGGWSGFIPFTTAADPAGWSYPAPSGLGIGQGTATVPVRWEPVAHGGVNAASYTLRILDSADRVFQEHAVQGTSQTVTIPRGTYTARVWADGGPVAPPHADFTFTV